MAGGMVAQTGAAKALAAAAKPRQADPRTKNIAGTTYIANPQNPYAQHIEIPGGSIAGEDGSVWSPMAQPPVDRSAALNVQAEDRSAEDRGRRDADARRLDAGASASVARNDLLSLQPPGLPPVPAPVAGGPDDDAGADIEFARAKDQTGRSLSAAMRSLQGELDARGVSGGGYEGARSANLLGEGVGLLGEASRDQALERVKRRRSVADRNYAGAITQRGQDITARGQEMGAWSAKLDALQRLAGSRLY